jgi:uncharacterized membrane protein
MARRRTLDWILEIVSLAAMAAIVGTVAAHWKELPARIPRHYGTSGNPDDWGDKRGLLLLPVTAAGLYLLLTAASRWQRLINVPMEIDREAPEVRRILLSMSITLKTVVLLIFLYIVRTTVNTAVGRAHGLGKQFLPISLVVIFLPLSVYLIKLQRCRQ